MHAEWGSMKPRLWRRKGVVNRRVLLGIGVLLVAALAAVLSAARRQGYLHDRSARIAYFIQVSGTNRDALPNLLRALCTGEGDADFAVHFDAAIPGTHVVTTTSAATDALVSTGCATSDLSLVPREHVTYRGVTLTHNILSGAAHLLRRARSFDYFVNLSAADYPVAAPALTRQLLGEAAARRLSFISWSWRATWARFAAQRFGRLHADTGLAEMGRGVHVRNLADNPLAGAVGFEIAKSSAWFILHRELVEHLVLGARPRRMLAAFAFSDIADEHYFATVVHNDRYFAQRTVAANWRALFFRAPNGTRSALHPFYVDETDADGEPVFWRALQRKPAFFTRKVHGPSELTRRIDQRMLGIAPDTSSNDREATRIHERKLAAMFRRKLKAHARMHPDLHRAPKFRSAFASRA